MFTGPASATSQAYAREDVRRLLDVSDRQLKSWQKQNFVSTSGSFNFSDILALRTLIGLRENKIPTSQIRKAVDDVRRRLQDVRNPLTELKIYSQGKKIRVQFEGKKMESISGQLLLDFDAAEINKLLSFPGQSPHQSRVARRAEAKREAEHWFEQGLELEQTGAPMEEIVAAYRKASELDPASAVPLVILGTVHFNPRNWPEAERQYHRHLDADPH